MMSTESRDSRASGDSSSLRSPTGITAVVLTRNVAAEIEECLSTLTWADGILVVDDFSADDTREICRRCGARVIERKLESLAVQRNFALTYVETPWVLFIDSDERVPPALADEIRAAARNGEYHGILDSAPELLQGSLGAAYGVGARLPTKVVSHRERALQPLALYA